MSRNLLSGRRRGGWFKVAFATLNQPPRLRAILETLMRADAPPWLRRGVRLPIFASRYHVCPPVSLTKGGVRGGVKCVNDQFCNKRNLNWRARVLLTNVYTSRSSLQTNHF